jgi:hypothetical protein
LIVDLNDGGQAGPGKEKDSPPSPTFSAYRPWHAPFAVRGVDESDMWCPRHSDHKSHALPCNGWRPPDLSRESRGTSAARTSGIVTGSTERVVWLCGTASGFTNNGTIGCRMSSRGRSIDGASAHCVRDVQTRPSHLEIACSRALDLRGEVIVPAYTFVATAHALQWQDNHTCLSRASIPATLNIAPASIEALIHPPNPHGILGVHVRGARGCDVDFAETKIEAIATKAPTEGPV